MYYSTWQKVMGMGSEIDAGKICAGIVTYNPELDRLLDNIRAILPQVSEVFLYDNGSGNIDKIKDAISSFRNVMLLEGKSNNGMSKALNCLCCTAAGASSLDECHHPISYRHILLLDQDSVAYENMVTNMMNYASDEIAILAPISHNRNVPPCSYETNRPDVQYASRVNTSGSIVNLSAFGDVGGYNEDLFVDWVDIEFCLRVREKGYKVAVVANAHLLHDLGRSEYLFKIPWLLNRKLVSRSLFRTNHSLSRQYDCARSWAILVHSHKNSPFLKGEKSYIVLSILQRMVTEPNKLKLMKTLWDGYRDGKNGAKHRFRDSKGDRNA